MATASRSGGIDSASARSVHHHQPPPAASAVERQHDAPARQEPAIPPHPRQEAVPGSTRPSSTHACVNDGQSERDVLRGSRPASPARSTASGGRSRYGASKRGDVHRRGRSGPVQPRLQLREQRPGLGVLPECFHRRARLRVLEPQSLPPVRQQPALQPRQLRARQLPGDRALDQRPESLGQRHRPSRTPPCLPAPREEERRDERQKPQRPQAQKDDHQNPVSAHSRAGLDLEFVRLHLPWRQNGCRVHHRAAAARRRACRPGGGGRSRRSCVPGSRP